MTSFTKKKNKKETTINVKLHRHSDICFSVRYLYSNNLSPINIPFSQEQKYAKQYSLNGPFRCFEYLCSISPVVDGTDVDDLVVPFKQ